tara:strand:- start:186 stop:3206 length:3021 start_codon:yes stop_codon:yes gene_type:complete
MTAPLWITPPGSLGTIVEEEFYQIQLNASNALTYEYLSGILPEGIRVNTNGVTEGYPKNVDYIQGVPKAVTRDTTNQFTVRATSEDGFVADRVFTITVTGPDAPVIDDLPASNLGSYFDGDNVNVQLTATDDDPGDTQTWKFLAGELPTGLSISTSGLISGYITPTPTETGTSGFDVNNWDIGSFDFTTISRSVNYKFTVQVSDAGGLTHTKEFTMFVASRNTVAADTTSYTADTFAPTADSLSIESKITADADAKRIPYLVTQPADFGEILHDNYYSFQFIGKDLDDDVLEYSITTGAGLGFDATGTGFDALPMDRGDLKLPPGMVMDPTSGWLSGYIPNQTATKTNYVFGIQVKKKNYPTYISDITYFTLTIIGSIAGTVTWPDADLGTIDTGAVSELDISATISNNKTVQYELKVGYSNDLPQGLRLESNGLITGRVSFECMMFDTGTTSFDKNNTLINETTFELKHVFTVRAYSDDLTIDTFQTFTLVLTPSTFKPYEALYIKALPVIEQRDIYKQLINNTDDISPDDVYRLGDVNFGIQQNMRALIASGLNPAALTDYIEAMAYNHHNNTLRFGDIKVAHAYKSDGKTVKYDIVYLELTDKSMGTDPTTKLPKAPSQQIDLQKQQSVTAMTGFNKPLSVDSWNVSVDSGGFKGADGNYRYAYPNAIENMRKRILDGVGYAVLERLTLPQWMQDKQLDNNSIILGYTLAVPMVYCVAGSGDKVAYLLKQRTTIDLKKISFEVDRFIVDNNLSQYYNKTTNKWTSTPETSFDLIDYGSLRAAKNVAPSATVSYAVEDYRFDSIDERHQSDVLANEMIPGFGGLAVGESVDIIWLKHEGLLGSTGNEGWNDFNQDSLYGLYFDSESFDEVVELSGYYEKNVLESATVNYQAGVWRLTVTSGDICKLTFVKEIDPGETVTVTYLNNTYYYNTSPTGGELRPRYVILSEAAVYENETIFDGGGTRFFASVDPYAEPDENDQYLKFPKRDVFYYDKAASGFEYNNNS